MPHEFQQAIEQLIPQVFEQMAFMFIDPAAAEDFPEMPDDAIRVEMSIAGDRSGRFTLATSRAMCDELAENLGISELEDTANHEPQAPGPMAIMELTNVACGQLLTAVAGSAPVFDLGVPELLDTLPASEWDEWLQSSQVVTFMADDHPLLIRLDFAAAA